ncbi:MAG: hypothetical protein A2059_00470 [Ignavibacteria bacterium GWA2_55_25]|nr:MAG: hypothetical protein A2059_00470 [Ignavibacteria bacterium GWA2_55_25]
MTKNHSLTRFHTIASFPLSPHKDYAIHSGFDGYGKKMSLREETGGSPAGVIKFDVPLSQS